MTQAEREAHRARIDAIRVQREAETAERKAAAALEATRRWKAAQDCVQHDYLSAKGVQSHGLRVEPAGSLIVPMRDTAGTLHGLQSIATDGDKRFMSGGRVKGCYHAIGRPDATVIVCEGYATGASIHECSGLAVAVAFNAGNLEAVALALRAKYPVLSIVIAADDDHKTDGNPGTTKATAAAMAVGGAVAVPIFPADRPDKATDFNDLHQLAGVDSVRACIDAALNSRSATNVGNGWPDPQPLIAKVDRQEYPLDALPDAVRCAVQEVAGFVKAPVPLIATSALAALSLAIQAHADVRRADKLHGPCGLFLLAIADSGERKTTCDGFFTAAIRDFEARAFEAAKPELQAFKSAHDAWEAQRNGLREKIKSLSKAGKPTAPHARELHDLDGDEPKAPRIPRLVYGDATPEALAYDLAKQWPSGGVISSEAGSVFGSHGMGKDSVMRNLAMLNQLWDGTTQKVDRRTSTSFVVRGARLTMALQVQEATPRAFFDGTKGLARGTGFQVAPASSDTSTVKPPSQPVDEKLNKADLSATTVVAVDAVALALPAARADDRREVKEAGAYAVGSWVIWVVMLMIS
jgi:putative DNA primase/helicase